MTELVFDLFLAQFELAEAKLIQLRLLENGVETEIRAHEGTCNTKNCKVTVELWGTEKDQSFIMNFFRQDFFKNLGHSDLNFEALNSVFDPSSDEVICQACATKFSSKLSICPDCGLCY